MSLLFLFNRARKRARAQQVIRKAVVETLESRRLLSITNFSVTGDPSVQEGHQAHFVLTADTNHDYTNPSLAVHIDFGDGTGAMDFNIVPGQTNDVYHTFHEERSSPAQVTCSVHDDGAFTYNVGPDDQSIPVYIGVTDADLLADSSMDVPCVETPDADGNTVLASDVTVGHFIDTASSDSEIGDFVATIDWGDGSTSQGQIVMASAPNYYAVVGNHAYDSSQVSPDPLIGNWPINVTVTDMAPNGGGGSEGGASVQLAGTAKVKRNVYLNCIDPAHPPAKDANGGYFKCVEVFASLTATAPLKCTVIEQNMAHTSVPIGAALSVSTGKPQKTTPASSTCTAAMSPLKPGATSQDVTFTLGSSCAVGDSWLFTFTDPKTKVSGQIYVTVKN